ncbi:MAG: aminotransferase class V-fold PLP-dependent enzyme [Chitinispirillaceae bacterium]|nr:aminotransferase class V-fold PLP-dependent enzyme [Chitinispirillaceae bacterium]
MIYLDNAATSFPKPEQTLEAASRFARDIGVSAGRSAHRRAVEASRIIFSARERLAALFNARDASRIVFTLNATQALNLILLGSIRPGDTVVTSSLEHNSVMRPLRYLKKEHGVHVEIIPCSRQGEHDCSLWDAALKKRPRLAVVNHGSNIVGTIAPVAEIGRMCRNNGVLFAVDAAQTAGIIPIDVQDMSIDLLAFSGHKGLLGLQGTGGAYLRENCNPVPSAFGGTGSNSESDEQPLFMPDRYESGTLNGPGLAALDAGVAFVQELGLATITRHGEYLRSLLFEKLGALISVRIVGPGASAHALPTVSIVVEHVDNGVVAQRLNEEHDIAVRVGLHCAPLAHRTIGTFPSGTIRISLGYFNTEGDVAALVAALGALCKGA